MNIQSTKKLIEVISEEIDRQAEKMVQEDALSLIEDDAERILEEGVLHSEKTWAAVGSVVREVIKRKETQDALADKTANAIDNEQRRRSPYKYYGVSKRNLIGI